MPDIYSSFRSLMANDATLAAQVSTRIYFERASDKLVFPLIVFEDFGSSHNHHLQGASRLRTKEFNVISYCEAPDADTVGETLRTRIATVLDGFRGTVLGVDIQGIMLEDESKNWVDADKLWAIEQTFSVHYLEP